MQNDKLNINIDVDLNNLNLLALEITKAYLDKNSGSDFSSPRDYTGSFIIAYSRILAELELIKQNKELLTSLIDRAMKIDFSIFEHTNED